MENTKYVAQAFLTKTSKELKRKYIIQNAISGKYWSGFHSNKNWTSNILEARLFQSKQEVEDWIKNNNDELGGDGSCRH